MSEVMENPVLTSETATKVTVNRQRKQKPLRTLESQPQSNRAAVSTPSEVNYLAVVRDCAAHKVSEGQSYVSRKGKSHLKALACAAVASQLGYSAEEGKDLSVVPGGDAILAKIDGAIIQFFSQCGADIAAEYDRITVRTQFAFDRVRETKDAAGVVRKEYEFGLAGTMRGERSTRDVSEARRTLNVLLQKHKKRMDYMLEHKDDVNPQTGVAPRFTQAALKLQAERIACVEAEQAKLPKFDGAVTPDEPRDVAGRYQAQR